MLAWICLTVALLPYTVYGIAQFDCPRDEARNIINGTYADQDNCGLYYHCNRGLTWPRQCPPGLHYYPVALAERCTFSMCVEPDRSECTNSEFAEEKYELVREELEAHEREMKEAREALEEDNNAANDYYPCYKDENDEWVDITLPNRKNCYQYYHCHRGISYPSECPPFSYYTPELGWRGPENGCNFQACQDLEDALCSIDGTWGEWGSWGECSTPCGDGAQIRERECDSPATANGGDNCPGYPFEPRLCNEGACRDNATAVFVYRLTDIQTGVTEQNPIDFEGIALNTDSSYSPETDTWTAASDGYYFFGLGTGILATQQAYSYLKNSNGNSQVYPSMGVRRSHGDHIGRDGGVSNQAVFYVNEGDTLNIAAGPETSMTADAGKPSYFTIFSLEDIGAAQNAFSVAYNASSNSPSSPLRYDQILTNEGGLYNPATGVFTAQTAGIYYLNINAGIDATNDIVSMDLTMSTSGTCDAATTIDAKISRAQVTYRGIDTLSRGVLMVLSAGCSVQVSSASAYYSSNNLETSFTGFLYNPTPATERVAFFVARGGSWSDSTALDPVPYDKVVVNEGNGWGADGLNNYFVAPVSGYYFIFMSVGAQANQRADCRLYRNDEYYADVYRQSVVHQDTDTLSRNLVVSLKEGDRLRVRAIANTAIYSSTEGYETSFGGFLLFAEESNPANEELLEQFRL